MEICSLRHETSLVPFSWGKGKKGMWGIRERRERWVQGPFSGLSGPDPTNGPRPCPRPPCFGVHMHNCGSALLLLVL